MTQLVATSAEAPRQRVGLIRVALLGCVFLGLFTEVLLSPYYPQFFRLVFAVDSYLFTGWYLFACRLTVALCSPLWGWLAKRFEPRRLLLLGQAGTALATASLAMAQSAEQFLVLTVLLLIFKSSYMLIYPILMELSGEQQRAGAAALFHAVHHSAVLLAAAAGAHMLQLAEPLKLFYAAAAADVVQLLLCIAVFGGALGFSRARRQGGSEQKAEADGDGRARGDAVSLAAPLQRRLRPSWTLGWLGATFLVVTLANQVVRPFFTPYTEQMYGVTTGQAGLLFLLPNAMALVLLPFVQRISRSDRISALYTCGIAAMAVGLLVQASSTSLLGLIAGRVLYGLFLAVTMVVLDLVLFQNKQGGDAAFRFSVVVSFQTAGELVAPLLASWLLSWSGLSAPLMSGALLCLLAALLFQPLRGELAVRKETSAG
ncbi:MFS transporter [Paenibacillus sp. YYML68]|uniref:MFS transporter n=1 Tax=Paenibacillus sp. YYML68 TaxID=2909250 RepID=UPI00249053F2|nr:MFS transporter [Paenibacillus sp. YYML68]